MRLLILGGTAWLGRELSRQALERGHEVCCLARGESGPIADGARLIAADRRRPGAYAQACAEDWDSVVEVSWQPGWVRAALSALRPHARHWIYVSSGNVYASHATVGADEGAGLLAPTDQDEVEGELYGQAKVACELASRSAGEANLLIARSGLIGGPGDPSDRAGYWVARAARDPLSPMLVPDAAGAVTQVIDIRDLTGWLITGAESGTVGTYDAVGPTVALDRWIAASRGIGGHTGPVARATTPWLLGHDVAEFMGPGSLPLWVADPDWQGFMARSGAAARCAGLTCRPIAETIAATLETERERGLDRVRTSGITPERETELIADLTTPP